MTTTRTARPKPVTAEALLEMNSRGIKGELIQGVLSQVVSAGGQHGEIAMTLGAAMLAVVRPNRLGRVTGTDSGVLLDRENNVVREPGLAFFSTGKLPLGEVVAGYYEIVPDLVVEIASPGDTNAEVNDKCRMWISYGVPVVWELHPQWRSVSLHRAGQPIVILEEDDILDGGDVLPGFSIPVRDIFDV